MNEFDQNDPKLWKWGLFYFNPRPRNLEPPNRCGTIGPCY